MPKTTHGYVSWREADALVWKVTGQKPARWMRGPYMMTLAVASRSLLAGTGNEADVRGWLGKFNQALEGMDMSTVRRVSARVTRISLFAVAASWGLALGLRSELMICFASFLSGAALSNLGRISTHFGLKVARIKSESAALANSTSG